MARACAHTLNWLALVGMNRYKCTWPGCTYAASGQGHISRHLRTHTGDKPYPCTEPGCTYSASQSGHLRTHMRTHTGERPFKCMVPGCTYAAGRSGHLARHMKIHRGDGGASAGVDESVCLNAAVR
jgi:insecticidal toxin complex protein TccC